MTDRTCSCSAGRGAQADVCNYVSLFIHFLLLKKASVCSLCSAICLKSLTTRMLLSPVWYFIYHSESDSIINCYHLIRLLMAIIYGIVVRTSPVHHEHRFTFSLCNMKKLHLRDFSTSFLTLHNDITVLTKC